MFVGDLVRLKVLLVVAMLLGLVTFAEVGDHPRAEAASAAAATSVPVLRTGTVLFIDGHRVRRLVNAKRVYFKGTKEPIVSGSPGMVEIQPQTQYRGLLDAADGDVDKDPRAILGVGTVLADTRNGSPLFRMYLRSGVNVGYRESTDGLHWHVRNADSVVIVPNLQAMSVFRDRGRGDYVMVGYSKSEKKYVILRSTDGIRFTRVAHAGSLAALSGDVIAAAPDPDRNRNLAIAKRSVVRGERCTSAPTYSGGRAFSTHRSGGYQSWAGPTNTVTTDCVDLRGVRPVSGTIRPMQFYGMPFQRYGDQYIGFPWLFRITQAGTPEEVRAGRTDGPVDSQLASTPDAVNTKWRRSDPVVPVNGVLTRPVLIARGVAGSWDDGMIYAKTPVINYYGRSRVYYTGWNDGHYPDSGRTARPGLATWRKDGFVGLRARTGTKPAEVHTRVFRLESTAQARHLRVNAKLAASGGWLRVGVKDARTGAWIKGWAPRDSNIVRGDNLNARVTWRGRRIGRLYGRPLQLVFRFSGARSTFYSYTVS